MTYKRLNPVQTRMLSVLATEKRLKRKHIRLLDDSGIFRFSCGTYPPSKSSFWALDPEQLLYIEMITAVHGPGMPSYTARRWRTFLQECCRDVDGPIRSGRFISPIIANAISEARR